MSIRTCLRPGCENQMSRGRICCSRHWKAVPNELRTRYYRARDPEQKGAICVEIREHFAANAVGQHDVTVCNGKTCKARVIWLETRRGKRMPVDAGTVSAEDHLFNHKRHTAHWASCPDADRFRSGRTDR